MTDDSFIREVNEEIRSDRARQAWRRYGPFIIAAIVALVLATAAYEGWQWYTARQASESGDRFLAALTAGEEGNAEDALSQFEALEQDGFGAYPVLARLRRAALLEEQDKSEEAVALFDEVAGDDAASAAIADLAALRAGYILVDTGSYEDVSARVERLSVDGNAYRFSAREALGLAAWKNERRDDALCLFQGLLDDEETPGNLRRRASIMVELLNGQGAGAEQPAG